MCLLNIVRLFMDGQFLEQVVSPTSALLCAWLATEVGGVGRSGHRGDGEVL